MGVPLGVTFYLVMSFQASLTVEALSSSLAVSLHWDVWKPSESRILAETVYFSCFTFLIFKMGAGLSPSPPYILGFCDII